MRNAEWGSEKVKPKACFIFLSTDKMEAKEEDNNPPSLEGKTLYYYPL